MRLAVVGTGLMGASVGLAAKRAGVDWVGGHDADEAAAEVALERGAVDEVGPLEELLADADLAVVAAPVTVLPGARRGGDRRRAPDRCTVTDVGSTKDWSLRLPGALRRRPSGVRARGARACARDRRPLRRRHLVPDPGHGDRSRALPARPRLRRLARRRPGRDRPAAHDRLVALTSHLPHALANLLVNQAGAGRIEGHDPLAAAGGSLRDMTRVAGANPADLGGHLPRQRARAREALAEHRRRVEQLEQALADGDGGYLARWVAEASENRRRMLADAYPDPGELQQVTVHVPDRPGVLAGITQALGAERINIEDFELRHFSPGPRRVLTVLVSGAEEAAACCGAARGAGLRRLGLARARE